MYQCLWYGLMVYKWRHDTIVLQIYHFGPLKVKICEWPDLPYSFAHIDCSIIIKLSTQFKYHVHYIHILIMNTQLSKLLYAASRANCFCNMDNCNVSVFHQYLWFPQLYWLHYRNKSSILDPTYNYISILKVLAIDTIVIMRVLLHLSRPSNLGNNTAEWQDNVIHNSR